MQRQSEKRFDCKQNKHWLIDLTETATKKLLNKWNKMKEKKIIDPGQRKENDCLGILQNE